MPSSLPYPWLISLIIGAISLTGAASSLYLALISLILEDKGYRHSLIGLSHSVQLGAIILGCVCVPLVLKKIGLSAGITFAYIVALLCLPVTWWLLRPDNIHFMVFLILRIVIGISISFVFLLGETWLNSLATSANRGKILGLYGGFLGIGLGFGPLLIRLTGHEAWIAYVPSALLFAASMILLLLLRAHSPQLPPTPLTGYMRMILCSPVVLAGAITFGICDASLYTLFPLYGRAVGLSDGEAVTLIAAGTIGGIVTQPLFGWLADKVDKRRLLSLMALLSTVFIAILPLAGGHYMMLLILLACWGGFFAMLYTLALVILGERFAETNISIASVATVIMYGIGSLIGPYHAGLAMDISGPTGLPVFLALVCLVCFLTTTIRMRRQEKAIT